MTTATPDFRALAIQCIADNAALYPPAGWAAEFDAAHAYIPAWATGGDKPNDLFRAAALGGHPNLGRQLSNMVAKWLTLHPAAPEIAPKIAEIRAAWDHNHEYPEDWAPYQRMIDDAAASADVPY